MPIASKIVALFGHLSEADVKDLCPFERQRFADLCRHWAALAEKPVSPAPKAGVLLDLRQGNRGH